MAAGCGVPESLLPASKAPPPAEVDAPEPAESVAGAVPAGGGTATQAFRVKLAAGVALPQSLPQGTVMSFSVDYRFTDGAPHPGASYRWLIAPSQGEPVEVPVELASEGTLHTFAEGLRPEQGPFQSHLAEVTEGGGRQAISASVSMRL
jgi:hypothetical protein